MSKNYIYCFSGSGNCLDIAKNIAKVLGDTDIVMLRSAPVVTNVCHAERVGFVFPCYAGGLPGRTEEYIRRVAVGANTYRFAVVSYAGYPGIGLKKIDDILGLDYWAGISHQSACAWLMPHGMMVPPLPVSAAQKRSEKLAAKVGKDVLNKLKKPGHPIALTFNKLEAAAWPTLAKLKSTKMVVNGDCLGCGQCAELCPVGNIDFNGGYPNFGKECIGCLSCLQFCPQEAINVGSATIKRERYHNPNVTPEDLMETLIHID